MLTNYFRIALRNLRRDGIYAAVNVAGLAAGMASVIFIMTWVYNERSFNRYHSKSDHIYRAVRHYITTEGTEEIWGVMPYQLAATAEEHIPEVHQSTQLFSQYADQIFQVNGHSFNDKAAYVSRNWFKLFDYEFIQGNPETFFKHPFSLILTESVAKLHFGNENPAGKTIRIDRATFVVRGVVSDPPSNSSFRYRYMIPMGALMSDPEFRASASRWGMHGFVTFFLLRKDAVINNLEDRITALYSKNHPQGASQISLQALKDLYFDRRISGGMFVHGNAQTVRIFTVIGLFVLIIACVNYINMSTARASVRQKGTGVRKVAGASKIHLFLQFMVEAMVMSFAALLVAFLLIVLLLPVVNSLSINDSGAFRMDMGIVIISGVVFFVTTLITGFYPSMLMASSNPVNLLKNTNAQRLKGLFLRRQLVVFQFVISILLISGTIVIREQLHFIQTKAPGKDLYRIFSVQPPFSKLERWMEAGQLPLRINSFKEAIASHVAVEDVVVASESIVNIENSAEFPLDWEGKSREYKPLATFIFTEPGFFDFFGLKMASGRWYQKNYSSDASNIVMNEAAIKTFRIARPAIGQQFTFPSSEFQELEGRIIGVVKDFHFRSLHEKIGPLLIVNDHPGYSSNIFIKSGASGIESALKATEEIWNDFFPETPFNYSFLDMEFETLYRSEQQNGLLFSVFSGIGIFISCLGLFGLTVFSILQRTREVGIRKILGASVAGVTLLLSKQLIKLVAIAVLIAIPAAWLLMNRWLQDFAYRIELRWWMFALAGLLAMIVALLTVSLQSMKAALTNPVRSLRSE